MSLVVCGVRPARAQVLAQKNWAGSGVTVELWWKRAVFYRVDPTRFQDSNGDGWGDLEGLDQRLMYLQTLGVDALILRTTPEVATTATKAAAKAVALEPTAEVSSAFDTLVRDAIGRHIRVLVELGAPASQQADAQYLEMARAWLNQGAAGIYVPTQALEKVDGAEHIALLLQQLRSLTDGFPGERVLLADAPAVPDEEIEDALAKNAQLTASTPLGALENGAPPTVAGLRTAWMADLGQGSDSAVNVPQKSTVVTKKVKRTVVRHGRKRVITETVRVWSRPRSVERSAARSGVQGVANPLLVSVRVPMMKNAAQQMAMERALAVMMLASKSAVLLEYGQELGLDRAGKNAPLMQWTPTNLTRKPPPPVEKPAPPPVSQYKGFLPWVKPLPRRLFPPPVMPVVEESDKPTPVDPALLPGFTAGNFDAALAAPNGATANVAVEDYPDGSLLNLYRQLIALHHDNATVRSGSMEVLNHDDQDSLVWVRRAPASSRTSTTVVVACNLSDRPLVLSGMGEVTVNFMRSLLQPASGDLMKVMPGMVMVGETR
ncbi:MAG: hypothetical protein WBY53_16235 [Acidobacteriaceae bacterium]